MTVAGGHAPVASNVQPTAQTSERLSGTAGALCATGAVAIAAAAASRPAMTVRSSRQKSIVRGAEPASAAAAEVKELPVFDPAMQLGAMAPLGYFDPAGLCKKGDEAGFRQLRAAELKHGRVAMMASVGAVAQHFIRFPAFESAPAGLSAVFAPAGSLGMMFLFVVSGALELGVWTETPSKEPGNFGDPFRVGQYDIEMRSRELNNGRFAMFSIVGIIAAELLTGKDAIEQFGF